jgi:hypothetical protein
MKLLNAIGTGLSLTVLCLLVAPKAKADDWNQKTTVTLTDPVEVPGVGQHLLPPGSYVFKLKNSSADRHIVEILNQDETQVLTTLLSVPNHRLKATGNTILTFSARPAGEPEALKAWFHAGEHSGEQFVWDSPRSIALAKQANESVLSTPAVVASASVDALNSAQIQAVNPNGEIIETAQVVEAPPADDATTASASAVDPAAAATSLPVPQPAVAPTAPAVAVSVTPTPAVDPAPVTPAQPVEEAAAAPAPPVTSEPVVAPSLPHTSSHLPLIGLVGLLSLGVGFGLLGFSKLKA